ncbi:Slc29a1 [Symbiodinium microadriaticum]|nr:Slc29a1 [Symbiodinium microadriaticum]
MLYSRAQLALMYLGICTLLPYNCLLNVQPYFKEYPFKDLDFPFTSMMTYSLCLCSSQIWLTCRGDGISVNKRMGTALISQVLVCSAFFGLTWASSGPSATGWYVPMLVVIAVLALSNSILQTGVFGVAGSMTSEMSAAVMLGLGMSGLVSFFISLLIQAVQHAMNRESGDSARSGMEVALLLWALCILQTITSCWVYFVYLRYRLPETAEAIAMLEQQRATPSEASGREISFPEVEQSSTSDFSKASWAQIWKRLVPIFGEIWPQAVNVCSVFMVTMTVFPGVMVHWEPSASSPFAKATQVYGNLLIGTFQVGDVVGRSIAGPIGRCVGPKRLWILVLLRFVFIPLFMLGQRSPEACVLWGSDIGRVCLCALFAISNGLLANLAMMYGPDCCSTQEKREVAGMAMSATMVTGIFAGTLLAFVTQVGIAENGPSPALVMY